MGEFDLEALVLDVVRKHTGKPSAAPRNRLVEDLGLSDNGRRALFAFMVEAFTAKGVNLPSRGFFLSDFLTCATSAEVHSAIRDALAGVKKKSGSAGSASAKAPAAGLVAATAAGVAPKTDAMKLAANPAATSSRKPKVYPKKKALARKGRSGR